MQLKLEAAARAAMAITENVMVVSSVLFIIIDLREFQLYVSSFYVQYHFNLSTLLYSVI